VAHSNVDWQTQLLLGYPPLSIVCIFTRVTLIAGKAINKMMMPSQEQNPNIETRKLLVVSSYA